MRGILQGVIILWISLGGVLSQTHYQEPRFRTQLFERDQLSLSREHQHRLSWALVAVARNFHEDETISWRVKSMALLLSHHLLPYDHDTLVTNYMLRHHLVPTPTAHFRDRSMILPILEETYQRLDQSEADDRLQHLLQDVMDEWNQCEELSGERWQGAVPLAPRSLKRAVTHMDVLGEDGKVNRWTLRATARRQEPFIIWDRGERRVLSESFRRSLEQQYPYFAHHLQGQVTTGSRKRVNDSEFEWALQVLIHQAADGWVWEDQAAAVPAPAGDLPQAMARLDAHFAREGEGKTADLPVRTLFVPSLPLTAFRDWMAFGQMHRLVRVEFLQAATPEEFARWHDPAEVPRKHAREAFLRARLLANRGRFRPATVAPHADFGERLRKEVIAQAPDHFSASLLLNYGQLRHVPKATTTASLHWLRFQADRVMRDRAKEYTPEFHQTVCDHTISQLRRYGNILHPTHAELARELYRFIEEHAIPSCRVRTKYTGTARRQFTKLLRAKRDWLRAYEKRKQIQSN